MKKVKSQTINKDKVVCLALMGGCLAMVGLYMYFVSLSVVHVVIRKEVSQELVRLNSDISQLESQFIEAQHRVSNKIASMEGYREVSEKVFIDRTRDSLVLSTGE